MRLREQERRKRERERERERYPGEVVRAGEYLRTIKWHQYAWRIARARARAWVNSPPPDKFHADVQGDGSNVPRSQPGAPKRRRLRDKISNGGKKS